jgi:hypothetical protein
LALDDGSLTGGFTLSADETGRKRLTGMPSAENEVPRGYL